MANPTRLSKEEIRELQERSVRNVEQQLAEGKSEIIIEKRKYSREAAWAAATSLRRAWEIEGARYGGQELESDGTWYAHILIPIGKFPEGDK